MGDTVEFGTITSTTGVTAGTTYYVKTVASANTITIAATSGGATLALTTDGSASYVRANWYTAPARLLNCRAVWANDPILPTALATANPAYVLDNTDGVGVISDRLTVTGHTAAPANFLTGPTTTSSPATPSPTDTSRGLPPVLLTP